jgi:hypothetical protein
MPLAISGELIKGWGGELALAGPPSLNIELVDKNPLTYKQDA